jgi:hypothetical protein
MARKQIPPVKNRPPHFFQHYDSITKQEYKNAIDSNVPCYILIEANVYTEYFTFLKNSDNTKITYAHVDSVNIFHLIRDILSQPRNNPVFPFERYSDVEGWLREQWAGLFKELLGRLSQQQQISTLASKVTELGEINLTLRRYLEAIISQLSPKESNKLIETENKRLQEVQIDSLFRENDFVQYMKDKGFKFDEAKEAMLNSDSIKEFSNRLRQISKKEEKVSELLRILESSEHARDDLNEARQLLGKKPFRVFKELTEHDGDVH